MTLIIGIWNADSAVPLAPDPPVPNDARRTTYPRGRANRIRANRQQWLQEDPETVAARYRAGELDLLDTIRRYGVIIDQRNGQLLPKTTTQFRESMQQRAAAHWS